MHDLLVVIATEKAHIKGMSADECVVHARHADPTADPLDAWLVKVGYGTTDVSDPAYNAWLLLQSACDRATEIVCLNATECEDGEYWYPLEAEYQHRVSSWTETLAELVTHHTPMVIAENSLALMTGFNLGVTERGANHPAVLAAWAQARKAVEAAWPNKVHKHQWKRLSPLERQAVYAR